MKKLIIAAGLLSSLSGKVNAQFEGTVYLEDSSVLVSELGIRKQLAWTGGLNSTQFASADLNNDGIADLVAYLPDQQLIKTFINYGTAGNPNYRYRPSYAKNFPQLSNYMVMRDYNRDGIMDLFHHGGYGFSAYKGSYNSANELIFTFYKTLYYNNDKKVIGWVNAEVNPGDIPAIIDVDNDGDLDFLSYYGDGYYMAWYQNTQVENGYPADSLTIRLADRCWGKMTQGTLRTHTMGISCDNSALSKTTDEASTAKVTDGGNTPCLLDMDGDGDYDLLDGHRAFDYVVYLRNSKAQTGKRDSMVYQDTAWVSLGDTVKIAQWAAVFHMDVDLDAKRDLIVTPNSGVGSEDYRCVRYYQNVGTDLLPSFQFTSDTFLIDQMLDMGTSAYPVLYDYDRDGKPDLFVGNKGYYEKSSGLFVSSVAYLHNTSTPGKPSFELADRNFLNIRSKRYRGVMVGIGDIDNDGKDDFLMGHVNGYIDYIRNTATSAAAKPLWLLSNADTLRDFTGTPVACNGTAVPLVYDMNSDGVKDLVIGDQSGYLFYYQNNSTTPGLSSLVFTNDQLGFVKADPEKVTTGFSAPFIGKIDNSGRNFLLMGSRSGRISRYTDFEGASVMGIFKRLDSAYSNILAQNFRSTAYFSAPAVADIDNDGKYEMVIGNIHGGLFLYKQDKIVSIPEPNKDVLQLRLFPNPSKDIITISTEQTISPNTTSVKIYNALGQEQQCAVLAADGRAIVLSVNNLVPGFYYCTLQANGMEARAGFVKQ
jgi:hypothetical protein